MKRLACPTSGCENDSGVGQLDAEDDGADPEHDREDDFGEGEVSEAARPERVGVFGKGREGGEAPKKAGGEEGEDPGRSGLLGEVAEEAADEEAAEEVAGEDADGEVVQGGLPGEGLQAGREAVASDGTKAPAQKDEEGIHEARVARRSLTFAKSLIPGESSAPLATSRATGRDGWRASSASEAFSGVMPPARMRGTCGWARA